MPIFVPFTSKSLNANESEVRKEKNRQWFRTCFTERTTIASPTEVPATRSVFSIIASRCSCSHHNIRSTDVRVYVLFSSFTTENRISLCIHRKISFYRQWKSKSTCTWFPVRVHFRWFGSFTSPDVEVDHVTTSDAVLSVFLLSFDLKTLYHNERPAQGIVHRLLSYLKAKYTLSNFYFHFLLSRWKTGDVKSYPQAKVCVCLHKTGLCESVSLTSLRAKNFASHPFLCSQTLCIGQRRSESKMMSITVSSSLFLYLPSRCRRTGLSPACPLSWVHHSRFDLFMDSYTVSVSHALTALVLEETATQLCYPGMHLRCSCESFFTRVSSCHFHPASHTKRRLLCQKEMWIISFRSFCNNYLHQWDVFPFPWQTPHVGINA